MERITLDQLAGHEGDPSPSEPTFRRGANEAEVASTVAVTSSPRPATERQVNYLRDLVAERAPETDPAYTEQVIAQGSARVSQAIKRLLDKPQVACKWTPPAEPERKLTPLASKVADGAYALETEGGIRFYKVNTPTDGKWAGFTFVAVMASDEEHPVRGAQRHQVLATIAKDPEAASTRFGRELGRCGRCGRTLTDEASRAAGVGPVCASKGW